MFKNYTKIIVTLLLMVMSVAFTSCKDDDEVNSGQVELLSFGPSGVKHGEEIKIIGKNLDKVEGVVLVGVESPITSFSTHTKELIVLTIPQEAEGGKLILKTSNGDIESKTILSFEVPVTITSITEEAKPGTNISIKGTKVNWIESVSFANDVVVKREDFVSRTQTEVVVTVPMEAQTGRLVLSTGGTEPLTIEIEDELIVTMPVITSMSPLNVKHTDDLTIQGSDLDLVTMVTFPDGTQVTKFESQTESQIVVKVPNTTGSGKIILTVFSGLTVESTSSISIILPSVASFSPDATDAHQAGVELVMSGENLDLVGEITFPGVAKAVTSFVSQTPNQIVVVIPEGVEGGTVALKTIHGYTIPIALPFGDQLELGLVIYDDEARNGYGAWGGWGGASFDINSTENPRVGTKSIKATYAGDWGGAAQFGSGSSATTGFASFAFSIYGGAGTDGAMIQLNVKSSAGEASKQVVIVEGEWTDYQIPLSELGNPADVTEIAFQDTGFSGEVYIDQIGLR